MMSFEAKLKHYRISKDEFEKIKTLLGREPQGVEWALFSALWSEHCSYKSSKVHLRKFAQTMNQSVVNAAGENAGVIDLGYGERIVFKMESHNHPSFIEPYQGAATGVGGILRDIFTMGARPIALANYLCFGEPQAPRMKALVEGVVRGIGGYGNCVGVPTVTGQTEFHSSYNNNILVNAMAVGLLRPDEPVALSAAQGPGNLVVYVGAKTGKDGVHGAAMASESFDESSDSKKPNVQIGDPYFEKLLIESCLEVLGQNLVVAIQDMGAAGLTSSSFEMASKGQVGMRMHLDKVPLRDSSMTPEEILLSESQERMLLVCVPQKLSVIQKSFEKWGLDAVVVGEVISDRKVQLYWKNELLTEIDPDLLVEKAPVYQREFKPWTAKHQTQEVVAKQIEIEKIKDKISDVIEGSREAIFRQYDQRVGAKTAHGADHDVAFLRLPDSGRGLAIAVGCRPKLMRLDAELGAYDAVFYPALQMAIKGAKAIAVTDCLNFGNPEKIDIMTEFAVSVEAITQASILLSAPVISGNVSFYNETLNQNITSTPATGLVGLRGDVNDLAKDRFVQPGNDVVLIRYPGVQISQDLKEFSGDLDPKSLAVWISEIQKLCDEEDIFSSQVVGLGGLSLTLSKMSFDGVGLQASHPFHVLDSRLHLYDVVLEVKSAEQLRKQTALELIELGVTEKKDSSTLKKSYDQALEDLIPFKKEYTL